MQVLGGVMEGLCALLTGEEGAASAVPLLPKSHNPNTKLQILTQALAPLTPIP